MDRELNDRVLFVDLDLLDMLNPYETRKDLAKKATIGVNSFKSLAKGQGTLTTVAKLATAMGVHPIDILVAEGYPHPKVNALVFLHEN